MSISSVSSFQNNSYLDQLRQRQAAEKAMMESIQSGDINGAQKNLAALQAAQKPQDATSVNPSSAAEQSPFRVLMKNDLSTMMAAVQTGDLTKAQGALSKMQADRSDYVNASSSSQDQTTSAFGKDFVALLGAVNSGDADKAKVGADALQADLQKLLGQNGTGNAAATAANATPNTPQSQDPLLKDIQDMVAAAQSGDVNAAKTAADQLAKDLSAIDSAKTNTAQAHHHHHHHHNAEAAGATAATTTPQATGLTTDPASQTVSAPPTVI